ncbi:UNVERIFIED_CONTAM: hypothetical protein Sradi_5047900 [Sesamum radiatum]|uniref:Uncharacterized protein n=1 Tax=Sesamum radiatum TaxID=300843 RepID=A0AAW2M2U0_SESRA
MSKQLRTSTPASLASTGDPKGKHQAEPMSPPAKKTNASSGSFVQPAPKPATRASAARPLPVQIKREKLDSSEIPSLLKEESESSRAVDFAKELLAPLDKSFLGSLPPDQIMDLLASCASKGLVRAWRACCRGNPKKGGGTGGRHVSKGASIRG